MNKYVYVTFVLYERCAIGLSISMVSRPKSDRFGAR